MANKGRVRWTGIKQESALLPRTRDISEEDWNKAGVETKSPKAISWNSRNGYSVPIEEFDFLTSSEFDRFIRADPDMVVEESDPE